MKFELLAGLHSNRFGHYKPGDIVTSFADLEKRSPNRFKRRHDKEKDETVVRPVVATTPSTKLPDTELAPAPASKKAPATDESNDGGDENSLQHPDDTGRSAFGTDVSEEYEAAIEADLRVFRKGSWHYVVDPDSPSKALNEKALKKDGVDEYIRSKFLNG